MSRATTRLLMQYTHNKTSLYVPKHITHTQTYHTYMYILTTDLFYLQNAVLELTRFYHKSCNTQNTVLTSDANILAVTMFYFFNLCHSLHCFIKLQ